MFAVAAAIWLSWDGALFDDVFSRVAIGAAVGGASSQLWDRLRRGFVVDFVDFGWWPAFNLADVGIVLGAGVAVARVVGSLIYAG
jgi:signal peptidase II